MDTRKDYVSDTTVCLRFTLNLAVNTKEKQVGIWHLTPIRAVRHTLITPNCLTRVSGWVGRKEAAFVVWHKVHHRHVVR